MLHILAILTILVCGSSAQTFCGVKDADESKTCISLRLPWQEDPIYFCTEKENIKYKYSCTNKRFCPNYSTSTNILQVATPWDCCTLNSIPDYCANRSCPAAPYNRTCTEIAPSNRPWDCCPTFLCDGNETGNGCQMKSIQAGCLTPPKDKSNCTAFKDEYGCCNKYQCANEGKSGMCPMEAQAMNFIRMMNNSTSKGTQTIMNKINMSYSARHQLLGLMKTEIRCAGDYTCPGQMKCCSKMMRTYYDFQNESGSSINIISGTKKRDQAIYGYCMEPVSNEKEVIAESETSSFKSSSSS